MTTSPAHFLNAIVDLNNDEIPLSRIAYFRERLRTRLHQLIIRKFETLEDSCAFNRARLARRIGREPAQVTRWLGASGNWTLDTVSDLLLGMGNELLIDASVLAAPSKVIEETITAMTREISKRQEPTKREAPSLLSRSAPRNKPLAALPSTR